MSSAQWRLLIASFALVSSLRAASAVGQDMAQVEAAAARAAENGIFAGIIHATRGDDVLLSKGFGDAVPELGVAMRNDHRYPIGSNTKLFTAVAAWQLHNAGKLNVYDPVTKYMNISELGLSGPWCPRAYNASNNGPCQVPQTQHLLRMSGGLLGFDNCEYPEDAWQQQYCITGPKIGRGLQNLTMILMAETGAVSMAQYLKASGVLNMPLDFPPGSSYHYSNPGYTLAGYIVEKVSGMPLANYFQQYIFNKANLSTTIYDVTNGAFGLHKNMLPYPAYIAYLAPAAGQLQATTGVDSLQDLVDSAGSVDTWRFGDVNHKTLLAQQPSAVLNPNNEQATGVYAFTARYPGPSNLDFTMANAAGAIVSTPQDMASWFRVLVTKPELLGLSKGNVNSMFGLTTKVPGMQTIGNVTWLFAQGVVVVPDPKHPRGLGVSHLYYVGSLGGFRDVVYVGLHPTDPAKDLFVNVLAATVLPDLKTWPTGISSAADGGCLNAANVSKSKTNSTSVNGTGEVASSSSVVGRRGLLSARSALGTSSEGSAAAATTGLSVPEVLCEVTGLEPQAMRTLEDLLVTKAVRAATGKNWFGLQ